MTGEIRFRIILAAILALALAATSCSLINSDKVKSILQPEQTTEPAATHTPEAGVSGIHPGTPRRLTTTPTEDLDPAWDPRGGTIAFMKSKTEKRPYDIGAVSPKGTNERVMAIGPNADIGIGGELTWVGDTGVLMANERVRFHEYMAFDTGKAPFTRTARDGNDAAFTRELLIPGGMGGDGFAVSRDGQVAMWRNRTSHDPKQAVITIRTAQVSSLDGQDANSFGKTLMTHSTATDGLDFDRGFSLSPDARQFAIALKRGEGFDLFIHDTSTGDLVRRLTDSGESEGVYNTYPDISPDGNWVAFSRRESSDARPDLYGIQIDGSGLTQITDTPDMSEDRPSWSPGGTEIAYQGRNHAETAAGWDIYAVAVR